MSATLTTVADILKEVYEGRINDQLNEERVTMKRIERTADDVTENIGGKYVVFPVRTGRNHGISYRAENTQLAAAGKQSYKAAQEQLKYGYGRVRFTGQMMRLARTNAQAFANALDEEMDGLKQDLGKDENRIIWGHPDQGTLGHTGILAKLTSSPVTSASFTVDDAHWLEVGMVVDTVNSGGPTVDDAGLTITAISGNTVTVDSTISSTSGYYLCRTGNYNLEPYGISNVVNSAGALHGLNPATAGQEKWKSTVDSTTTNLTELAMITMADRIRIAGGSKVSAVFCSLGVRRAYWNILTGMRRFNEPKKFTGGLVGLAFQSDTDSEEIPVVADPDAPSSTMVMLTESECKVFMDKDWYWEDLDGSIFKWVSNYDAWEALMKQYWQFGTHKRNAHGKFTALTEVTA